MNRTELNSFSVVNFAQKKPSCC